MKKWISVAQYARLKGIGRGSVYYMLYRGKIPNAKYRLKTVTKKYYEILVEE